MFVWCLTPLSTICQLNIVAVSFIGGRNLLQVTDQFYHIMLYTSPWSRFELTTSVVICTYCIGRCKSNYHTFTAMTAPCRIYVIMFSFSIKVWIYVINSSFVTIGCFMFSESEHEMYRHIRKVCRYKGVIRNNQFQG